MASVSEISDLTRIPKDDVKSAIALLNSLRLVETKGMLAFLQRKVTADGVRALSVYRKVYGSDEDVLEVEENLAEEETDGT